MKVMTHYYIAILSIIQKKSSVDFIHHKSLSFFIRSSTVISSLSAEICPSLLISSDIWRESISQFINVVDFTADTCLVTGADLGCGEGGVGELPSPVSEPSLEVKHWSVRIQLNKESSLFKCILNKVSVPPPPRFLARKMSVLSLHCTSYCVYQKC